MRRVRNMSEGKRIMRNITIFLLDNRRALCLGLALTFWLIGVEYNRRGYFAIGGEWLVTPALLALRMFFKSPMEGQLWDIWRS